MVKTPSELYTNSFSLFDIFTKASSFTENRLLIELLCMKNVYEKRYIGEVWSICVEYNLAEVLPKEKPKSALMNTSRTEKFHSV